MQALKAIVIVMGVLIVGAISMLSYGILNDWHKKKPSVEVAMDADVPKIPPAALEEKSISTVGRHKRMEVQPFGDWSIKLPEGAKVFDVKPKHNMLYIHYETSDGHGGVMILNIQTKIELGHIKF